MFLWKEVVKPGVYFAQGRWVRVRESDILEWVDNFQKMREAGLQIPVPYEHPPEASFGYSPIDQETRESVYRKQAEMARHNAGWLADLEVRGKSLFAKLNLRDEDAKKLQEAGGYVSPHFRGFWTDGNGRTWKNAILHMAITLHPVNSSQSSEFKKQASGFPRAASFSAMIFSGDSGNQSCSFSLCDFLENPMPKSSLAKPAGNKTGSKASNKSGNKAGVSMGDSGNFPPKKKKPKIDGDGDGMTDSDDDGEDDDSEDDDSSSPDGLGDSGESGDSSESGDSKIVADSGDATADSVKKAQTGKLIAEMATLGVILPPNIDLQGDIDVLLTAIQTHKATKDVGKSEDAASSAANSPGADQAGTQSGERQVQPVSMSTLATMSVDDIASRNPAVKNLLASEAESQKNRMLGRVDNLLKSGRATIPQATKIRDLIGKHSFSAAAVGKPGHADSELEARIATLEENPENAFLNAGGDVSSFSAMSNMLAGQAGAGEGVVQQDSFFTATGGPGQPIPEKEVKSIVDDLLGIKR